MTDALEKWKGKVAVITGASSGIGKTTVIKLMKYGLKVVGIARRKEKVEELIKPLYGGCGRLYAVKADMTKENDVINAFKWIKENVGPVHILINCAGIYRETNLTSGNTQMWKDTINTNVLGLCVATREACIDMKLNNIAGHIIHINSVTGHQATDFPGSNVYPATKYAVTALAETFRHELSASGSKIKITSISPASVASDFSVNSEVGSGVTPNAKPNSHYHGGNFLAPEDVADTILYVLSTPAFVQIHELMIHSVNDHY